jgi:hypothetical protein
MKLATFAAVFVLAGCTSTPTIQTDHDSAADFSSYRTYAWLQQPAVSSPLHKQRLIAAIDAELGKKGWTLVSEERADIALVGNVATHEEQTIETFYDAPVWNSWGWQRDTGSGPGYRSVQTHTYKMGTLVLDMLDNRTKQAVWRGTAEGTIPDSPEKISAAIQQTVVRMFATFPP